MQRQTTIAVWCERILEGGWLLALVFIPSYFNLLSSRHFEPDKATSLRAIVLVMAAAAIIRSLEQAGSGGSHHAAYPAGTGILQRAWQWLNSLPLALPTLLYVLIFLFATATSVVPLTSFWGSYQRLQGTYTNLSYVALATLIVLTLRRREQLARLIIVTILGSLPAIGYGLIQHSQQDPLPWKGDVISRVASTMGNSIFVAAYMIMVTPFALYRSLIAFRDARTAKASSDSADWGWAAAYLLLIIGSLALLFSTLKFGAVVRTNDLRYWWVYPAALFVVCGLYIVPTLRPQSAKQLSMAILWPGLLTAVFVLLLGFFFFLGQSAGNQVTAPAGSPNTDWPFWLLGGLVLVGGAYGLMFALPRREAQSRLLLNLQGVGLLGIALLLLLTIFFTQSRGPWLGIAGGLFVFFTLLLWRLWRRARAAASPRQSLWRNLLLGEVVLAIVLGGFILAFNLIDTPVFDHLRQLPYIGRLGTLTEVDTGTGRVRSLIWFGDDKAGGAVGLILSDPVRTVIGWGPESMFVAYNKFYPPALANIEARGASPDRSHEAYLDELVTKGFLGLISYLFVLISFLALAWGIVRRTTDWSIEVLCLAAISVVVAHLVEGLTGIPIVSSLMMLWVTMAVVVMAGALDRQYSLDRAQAAAPEPEPEPTSTKVTQSNRGGRRRQGAAARGAAQGRAVRSRAKSDGNAAGLIVYALIGLLALAGVWFFNIDNVYADMRFNQGQLLTESSSATTDQQLVGLAYYVDAIRMEPQQDFYYLNLGRTLMTLTDIKAQSTNGQLGQVKPNAKVDDLLSMSDATTLETLVARLSPLETMSYAQAVLEQAQQLNQLNKDHYANLARMHSFWYSRLTQDPDQLQQAIDWYRRGHEIAPQDVTILNEYASTVATMGSYMMSQNDTTGAQAQYTEASQLLAQSKQLDERYSDTDLRMADVLRLQGHDVAATDQYLKLLASNPHALDTQFNQIADGLRDQPDQLRRLRDMYTQALAQKPDDPAFYSFIGLLSVRLGELPQAVEAFSNWARIQPQSYDALRNYTLVLSDTRQYPQAIVEAQSLLTLAQSQQMPQNQQSAIQNLLDYLKQRSAGG